MEDHLKKINNMIGFACFTFSIAVHELYIEQLLRILIFFGMRFDCVSHISTRFESFAHIGIMFLVTNCALDNIDGRQHCCIISRVLFIMCMFILSVDYSCLYFAFS